MRLKITGLLFLLILTLTACSGLTNPAIQIDWVDFIVLNDINYSGKYSEEYILSDASIDKAVGEVKFNVADNIKSTSYKVKNGDAAYLPKGTKLYKIKEYSTAFRIAVNHQGKWRIYEADTNPNAKNGKDLLDISGKVLRVGINSETDGKTELAQITRKDIIEKLVKLVLNAEVDQKAGDHDGERYFIKFYLADGSDVNRSYWINSGELSRGIMLPEEFRVEIKNALESGQ